MLEWFCQLFQLRHALELGLSHLRNLVVQCRPRTVPVYDLLHELEIDTGARQRRWL